MNYKLKKYKKFSDSRGDLIVFLKESELEKNYKQFGQIYLVTFKKKGVVRGNHYHKKWHEWFGVIAGRVKLILKDVISGKTREMILSSRTHKYMRLEIGPNIAHAFKSLSNYAALVNYADSEWDNKDSIKYEILK